MMHCTPVGQCTAVRAHTWLRPQALSDLSAVGLQHHSWLALLRLELVHACSMLTMGVVAKVLVLDR